MFNKTLEKYRNLPIPSLNKERAWKIDYRNWTIDADDQLYKEICVDAREYGIAGLNYYNRSDNPPYYASIPGSIDRLILRKSIAEKMLAINTHLNSSGLELFIHDAWRPAAVQSYFHDEWFPQYLKQKFPDWSKNRIAQEVTSYWAHGSKNERSINSISPPPHSTGAASDLTIRKINGDALWMGTLFDDVTERSHSDYLERHQNLKVVSFSDEEALKNRRLLYWIMTEAGFLGNPTEWWHFSWGDQMWAKITSGQSEKSISAWYSVVNPLNL